MKSLLVIFALVFGSVAQAKDAGCGLGSMIISKNSKLLQLFAMTTNHSFFTQPLGITSGTSGCSASGIVMDDKQIQYFVEVNQEDIQREMSEGRGDKLSTLALLNGCASEQSQAAFATTAQKSYSQIVPAAATSSVEMVQNIRNLMKTDSELSQLCHGS